MCLKAGYNFTPAVITNVANESLKGQILNERSEIFFLISTVNISEVNSYQFTCVFYYELKLNLLSCNVFGITYSAENHNTTLNIVFFVMFLAL